MIATTNVNRIHPEYLKYLRTQYNCNLKEAENNEEYLNQEDWPVHMQIVDQESYFALELIDNWPIQ